MLSSARPSACSFALRRWYRRERERRSGYPLHLHRYVPDGSVLRFHVRIPPELYPTNVRYTASGRLQRGIHPRRSTDPVRGCWLNSTYGVAAVGGYLAFRIDSERCLYSTTHETQT